MEPIISVRGLGKRYNINQRKGSYITLRDSLTQLFSKPFSFIRKKLKDPSKKKREDFWALKDINFEVQRGEVLGIIGHNGAGKSTLLKILSQITPPTTGEIRLRGRIGSLLEVGTGFHPELTGRENIFLNAAILGMRRKEIEQKFDKIVEFSEIGTFLDTPVKYYSSGMHVRLAFSVAAHLDPDILVLDEVLAVGDSDFQRKCFQKIQEITQAEGRTILFVSHNMNALLSLCSRAILLERGQLILQGPVEEVVNAYLKDRKKTNIFAHPADTIKDVYVAKAFPSNERGESKDLYAFEDQITLQLELYVNIPRNVLVSIVLLDSFKRPILLSERTLKETELTKDQSVRAKVYFPKGLIAPGAYSFQIRVQFAFPEKRVLHFIQEMGQIEIGDVGTRFENKKNEFGVIAPDCEWEIG